jgi:hypothetical protein
MTHPYRRTRGRFALVGFLGAAFTLSAAPLSAAPPAEAPPTPAPTAPDIWAVAPSPDAPNFAVWVMENVDDLYRGESSHGLMAMTVKTKHWTRSVAMESWSLGTDYSLVRIVAPKKERGTSTLKAKDTMFTYLSKIGRTIKINGSMMGGAWMGSHFTNDDLIQGTRLSDDFVITRATDAETPETFVFRLVPKPDAPVVWGKIESTVRRADLMPLSQIFFDEEGEAMRRMDFSDYTQIAGRQIPRRTRMTPLDKPGEYTEILHKRIEFDIKIEESFFTLQKLRSM